MVLDFHRLGLSPSSWCFLTNQISLLAGPLVAILLGRYGGLCSSFALPWALYGLELDLPVVALLVDAMVSTNNFSSFCPEERLEVALFTHLGRPMEIFSSSRSSLVKFLRGGSLLWFPKLAARFFDEGASLLFRFWRFLQYSLKLNFQALNL